MLSIIWRPCYRCEKQAQTYGYTVEYGGIGEPPVGREEVGHCSQSAMFRSTLREEENNKDNNRCQDEPYKLVREWRLLLRYK